MSDVDEALVETAAVIIRANHDAEYEADTARAVLAAVLPTHRAQVAEEVLREALDAWQFRDWAGAPRRRDQVQERIANAQYVTDWLRARAERAARIARTAGGADA